MNDTAVLLTRMHLERIAACTTLDALRQAGEAINVDAERIAQSDLNYLRSMASEKKRQILAHGRKDRR